jgi:hypothetical protein
MSHFLQALQEWPFPHHYTLNGLVFGSLVLLGVNVLLRRR